MIRLITRGDDAGSSRSANRAIRQCCDHGLLRNFSIMACGPAFDDAVRVLDGMENVALGLHACLSAEWDTPRWGSVLPREQVPTLLDESGMFTHAPNVLQERGFSIEEAMREIEAQLDKARHAGLKISYIDEHMGVSGTATKLRAGIAELAGRENLMDVHGFAHLPNVDTASKNAMEQLRAALSSTRCGSYVLVTHPMFDDDEARSFCGAGQSGEQIAQSRNHDRVFWQSSELQQIVREFDIQIVRYNDPN